MALDVNENESDKVNVFEKPECYTSRFVARDAIADPTKLISFAYFFCVCVCVCLKFN